MSRRVILILGFDESPESSADELVVVAVDDGVEGEGGVGVAEGLEDGAGVEGDVLFFEGVDGGGDEEDGAGFESRIKCGEGFLVEVCDVGDGVVDLLTGFVAEAGATEIGLSNDGIDGAWGDEFRDGLCGVREELVGRNWRLAVTKPFEILFGVAGCFRVDVTADEMLGAEKCSFHENRARSTERIEDRRGRHIDAGEVHHHACQLWWKHSLLCIATWSSKVSSSPRVNVLNANGFPDENFASLNEETVFCATFEKMVLRDDHRRKRRRLADDVASTTVEVAETDFDLNAEAWRTPTCLFCSAVVAEVVHARSKRDLSFSRLGNEVVGQEVGKFVVIPIRHRSDDDADFLDATEGVVECFEVCVDIVKDCHVLVRFGGFLSRRHGEFRKRQGWMTA